MDRRRPALGSLLAADGLRLDLETPLYPAQGVGRCDKATGDGLT